MNAHVGINPVDELDAVDPVDEPLLAVVAGIIEVANAVDAMTAKIDRMEARLDALDQVFAAWRAGKP
jgi:hypothetical protein